MSLGMSTPGVAASLFSQTNQFIWGGSRAEILEWDAVIDSAAVDAGSHNTKVLRAGLAMGRVTASGKLRQWNPDADDGTEDLVGFLKEETPLIDRFARAQDAWCPIVVKAPVKAAEILVLGVKFKGSGNDDASNRTAIRARFFLDDEV